MSSEVTAQTECRGWVIQWEHCREKMLADPVFLRALCVASNEKAVRVTAATVRNQNYPLKNRLATFLLNTQHRGVYREPHAQAAAYLGVSYRHLLSVLAAFQQEGLVEKTPEGYHLRLGRLAGPANSGCAVAQKGGRRERMMQKSKGTIRRERPADYAAVEQLTREAFLECVPPGVHGALCGARPPGRSRLCSRAGSCAGKGGAADWARPLYAGPAAYRGWPHPSGDDLWPHQYPP